MYCALSSLLLFLIIFSRCSVDPYRNPQGSLEQSEDLTEILDPVTITLPSRGFNPDVLLNLAMEKYIRKVNQDMFVVKGAAHYIT